MFQQSRWNNGWILLCVLQIIMAIIMSSVQGFSNILLSRSGCYTELDTEEVIMNHKVEPAVANPPLQITIVAPTDGEGYHVVTTVSQKQSEKVPASDPVMVVVEQFPITVQLKVMSIDVDSNMDLQSYEFVLDIHEDSNASFTAGSCTDEKRIAGHGSKTMVELHVREPNTIVWGSWAKGHEAVKLLRGLKFVSDIKEEEEEEL